jgi:hypothetical protein
VPRRKSIKHHNALKDIATAERDARIAGRLAAAGNIPPGQKKSFMNQIAADEGMHIMSVYRAEDRALAAVDKHVVDRDPELIRAVLELVATGLKYQEIGDQLGVHKSTVSRILTDYATAQRKEAGLELQARRSLTLEKIVRDNMERGQQLYDNPPPKLTPQGVPAKRKTRDANGNEVIEEIVDAVAYTGPYEQARKAVVNLTELEGSKAPSQSIRYDAKINEKKSTVVGYIEAIMNGEELPELPSGE